MFSYIYSAASTVTRYSLYFLGYPSVQEEQHRDEEKYDFLEEFLNEGDTGEDTVVVLKRREDNSFVSLPPSNNTPRLSHIRRPEGPARRAPPSAQKQSRAETTTLSNSVNTNFKIHGYNEDFSYAQQETETEDCSTFAPPKRVPGAVALPGLAGFDPSAIKLKLRKAPHKPLMGEAEAPLQTDFRYLLRKAQP